MNSSRAITILTLILAIAAFTSVSQGQAQPGEPKSQPQSQEPAVQPAQAQTQQENAPTEGQTLHILVGKSVVINVQAPMTRVLSSNPAAVEAMATSPTQVVVEGKAAGNSSLILWDASSRSQILDVSVDLDIAGLQNAIQHSYPNEQLQVEADAGRLVLTGTAS